MAIRRLVLARSSSAWRTALHEADRSGCAAGVISSPSSRHPFGDQPVHWLARRAYPPYDRTCLQVTLDGVVQARQQGATLAGQGNVVTSPPISTERPGRTTVYHCGVQSSQRGDSSGERGPTGRLGVRQVPDAVLTVDEQIQCRVDQVRQVGGRGQGILGGREGVARGERP